MTFTIGSLFSGIGGLELGLERAGLGPVLWQVEINPFSREVLAKHWPNVTRYEDVREVAKPAAVDLICGGFPCQDLSDAHTRDGRGGGLLGPKSGLWSEFRRIVRNVRPRFVLVENISPSIRWLPEVRRDLYELGYSCMPLLVRASDVGAPHERPRVFAVAYSHLEGEPPCAINAQVAGVRALSEARRNWGAAPPGGFRVDDGVSRAVDRNRALGNAVVPAAAEVAGRMIAMMAGQKGSEA